MTSPTPQETGPLTHGPPLESFSRDFTASTNAATNHVVNTPTTAADVLQDLARGPIPTREMGLTVVPVKGSHKQDPTSPNNEDPQIGQLRGLICFALLVSSLL
ncbi:uncharacterized protein PAC_19032 [Phialocephala subalpina]|uniref:Uncharacterized protein n=1 Tax=Phialocephala subalpina TaxID=576137 RepID=A0A1L7XVQ4_9HELO|nr:uncharacterized protein PAC_19032 [Phialocephala subalpina]